MVERISDQLVEEIRSSIDIVDVVGEYVQLKKQGRNYFGLCPFHSENTPSFSVTQDKQIFHCFGCGKGGNVYTFIMEMEGYSFGQALRLLAEKAGKQLPQISTSSESNQSDEANQILEAYQWLSKLYHHLLYHSKDGKDGLKYLKERGFTDQTIEKFQLGFSPHAKEFIAEFLEKKGYHRQTMVKAGLLAVNDRDEYYDRFQGRIIFPIRNHIGKCIGFGGRTITHQEPKYLNSAESSLFQKGKLFYNFDLARSSIRKEGVAVLFEGYADVIAAYQADVSNGIATLGTSLTDTQARLLRRYVDTVLLCYDGDDAGLEATYKASQLLMKYGCNVKIAALPYGLDPDDFIKDYGADKFKNDVIEAGKTYMAFMIDYLKKDFKLHQEGDRIQYIERVMDEIAKLEKPIEREYYMNELVNEYNISMEVLTEELKSRMRTNNKAIPDKHSQTGHTKEINQQKSRKRKKLLPAYVNAERQLLKYMLQDHTIAEQVRNDLGVSFNIDDHKVIATYLYGFYENGHEANVSQFLASFEDGAIRKLVVELSMDFMEWEISEQEIDDYIRLIKSEQDENQRIKELIQLQKNAERQNDPIKAAELAMEILRIKKEMKN